MISQPRWKSTESGEPGSMDDGAPENTEQAIDAIFKHAAEVRDYALLYVETRKDQLKVVVRQVITYAMLGVLALLAGTTAIIVSVVLLLSGVAGAIGRLLGDRLWAGQLITGGLLLLVVGMVIYFGIMSVTKTSRRRLGEKYERRRQELRKRFGHEASPRCEVGKSPE